MSLIGLVCFNNMLFYLIATTPGGYREGFKMCCCRRFVMFFLLTCFSVSLSLVAGPALGADARFVPLGDLPGHPSSFAYGISADGSTIVGMTGVYSRTRISKWTESSGWIQIGQLPGERYGYGLGVSGNGEVVVGESQTATGGAAIRWSADEGIIDLGLLPNGSRPAYAYGASHSGDVVVGFAGATDDREAFRWTADEGMVGLGYLDSDVNSTAHDVSADGSIIVGRSEETVSSLSWEAFRWSATMGMVGLGQLPGGGFGSSASAISGDGNVICGYADRPGVHKEGFRWTAEGGMVGIGDLPGGIHWSEMSALNYDGSVMVGMGRDSDGFKAAIWDSANGIRSMEAYLRDDLGIDLIDGWRLDHATGISDDGTRIVGLGVNPQGIDEAWMIVVPEPGSAILLLLGLCVGYRRERKAS